MAIEIEMTWNFGEPLKIEVKNVKGEGCLKVTEELEKRIGDRISRTKTGEYFESEVNANLNQGIKI